MARIKPFVGLLFSPTSVEAVQCSQSPTGEIHFDFYHHLATTQPLVDEDGDIENSEALGDVLAQLWREAGIPTRDVVLGLSGKRAIARLVQLPRIPANQMHQVVLSEAEQYSLFRDEEPLVDYFTVDSEDESTTIFYAAASQRLINAYRTSLKRAKLRLMAVDIAQYSALRSLVHFKLSDSETWDGIIVIPGRLVITSWFGQKLLNWREVSTQRWEEQGEEQRYQFMETELSRTLRLDPGKERDLLLSRGTLAESSIMSDYFRSQTELPLQAVGIDYWASRVPVEVLEHISYAALGLGLWRHENHIPNLDLLNRSTSKTDPMDALRDRLSGVTFDRSVAIAGAASVLSFAIGFGGSALTAKYVIGKRTLEVKSNNVQLTSLNQSKSSQLEALRKREAVDRQILELMGETARPNAAVTFLTQIGDVVPPDSWLMTVDSATPESLKIRGASLNQQACLTLAQKISEFQEVNQVKVTEMSQAGGGTFNYAIEVSIDPNAVTVRPASPQAAAPVTTEAAPPAGMAPVPAANEVPGQIVTPQSPTRKPEGH